MEDRKCVYSTVGTMRKLCKIGQLNEAVHILDLLGQRGIPIFSSTYAFLIQECTDKRALNQGKWVHAQVVKNGFLSNVFLANTLISMYVKCGAIKYARQVFDTMPERDVISWTTIISGYTQHGYCKESLKLFYQMQLGCVKPDNVAFVSVLKACVSLFELEWGKQIHAHIIKSGHESDIIVGSTLVDMYAKCGKIKHARKVFDGMLSRNVVSWTAMISGYALNRHGAEALELFHQMQQESIKPNRVTVISILKACASLATGKLGKEIHAHIIKSGFELDVFVGTTLLDTYAKCGSVEHARHIFDKMSERNVISWNAMIAGYAQHGHGEQALDLFQQMEHECLKPSSVTFLSVLKACASMTALEQGMEIHAHIIKARSDSDVFVQNALIDMYTKCRSIEHAHQVFDKIPKPEVISWNTLIVGYVRCGLSGTALKLFKQMQQECVKPTNVTLASVLKACAGPGDLGSGKQIHACVIKIGCESDVFVGNALVDMYVRCGRIEQARQVFEKMPEQTVISWTSMIVGYTRNVNGEEALKLFWQMHWDCAEPDSVTFISVLKACADLAAIEQGKQIHACIVKSGLESDALVGNSLVDMYAKCGSIEHARQVFDNISERDLVSWNVMIGGYGQHGLGMEALELFLQMEQECVKPDHITFTGVLSACSHMGLLDEGQCFFDFMVQVVGIMPVEEHYACMVDLLGRSGCLEVAEGFIKKMPFEPTAVVWMALLGACRVHGHMELAEHAAECVLEVEPQNAAAFVLLSNIYTTASRWDDKSKVRKMMDGSGVRKMPGCSCIELKGQVHAFVAEDTLHHK